MRSVLLIGLVMLVAVAGGGYCIAWYAQARQMKAGISEAVARLNRSGARITYDAIETSGFPGDVVTSIINPHFSGRIDLLLKSLRASPGQPDPFATLPAWQEDDALAGRIAISINALSSRYRFAILGNLHHQSRIGGQTQNADIRRNGAAGCMLELSHAGWFATLWDYEALLHRKEILRDLRTLDCASPGYVMTGAHQETLMQSAATRFYISSLPKGDSETLRVYLALEGAEVTPAGDAWLTALGQAFGRTVPSDLALYGRQAATMDITYAGPLTAGQVGKIPLSIHVNPLSVTSQAYHVNASLDLTDSGNTVPREERVSFKAVSNFGDNYQAIQQNVLKRMIEDMYAHKAQYSTPAHGPDGKAILSPSSIFHDALNKYTPDQMYAILSPAVPHLHDLGQLTQSVDASFEGDTTFKTGDLKLDALELSATPYGITGKGEAQVSAGAIPSGNLTFVCANCLHLVDDVTGYAGRLHTAYNALDPGMAGMLAIDPKMAEAVKGFLSALATKDATGNNFTFAIVSKGPAGASINGKAFPEVMQLYDQYIGAVLRQKAAANAAAPAPAAPAPTSAH